MSEPGTELAVLWTDAVRALGGTDETQLAAGADNLVRRHAEPHRRAHDAAYATTVLRAADVLAAATGLTERDRAIVTVASAARSVVRDGRPGDDERRAAMWARSWLTRAGVSDDDAIAVADLVRTVGGAVEPGDDLAAVVLDADRSVLGAAADDYDGYRVALREEHGALDDDAWTRGRAAALRDLLAGDALFRTPEGVARWDGAARANLRRELDSLHSPVSVERD